MQYKVPVAGIAIGDGWIYPFSLVGAYSDMLFNFGVADVNEKAVFEVSSSLTQKFISQGVCTELLLFGMK